MSSTSLFLDSVDKQVVLSEIEEFDVNDDYIFATKRKEVSIGLMTDIGFIQ